MVQAVLFSLLSFFTSLTAVCLFVCMCAVFGRHVRKGVDTHKHTSRPPPGKHQAAPHGRIRKPALVTKRVRQRSRRLADWRGELLRLRLQCGKRQHMSFSQPVMEIGKLEACHGGQSRKTRISEQKSTSSVTLFLTSCLHLRCERRSLDSLVFVSSSVVTNLASLRLIDLRSVLSKQTACSSAPFCPLSLCPLVWPCFTKGILQLFPQSFGVVPLSPRRSITFTHPGEHNGNKWVMPQPVIYPARQLQV